MTQILSLLFGKEVNWVSNWVLCNFNYFEHLIDITLVYIGNAIWYSKTLMYWAIIQSRWKPPLFFSVSFSNLFIYLFCFQTAVFPSSSPPVPFPHLPTASPTHSLRLHLYSEKARPLMDTNKTWYIRFQ